MKPRSAFVIVCLVAIATLLGLRDRERPLAEGDFGRAAYRETAAILEFGPRPPGSEALDGVRARLRRELDAAGWRTVEQAFDLNTPIGPVRFSNVLARYGDEENLWARPVKGLLGAHVDSKLYADRHFVGADDAASACAAIVVIARHLAERHPARAREMELVFFDGEEAFREDMNAIDGLYGSRHYAAAWRGRGPLPAFGIVLDMIGHRDLAIRLPSDSPPFLRDRVLQAAGEEGAAERFGMAAGPILDDHVPLNLVGIPTIDIIGDFQSKDWWHQPEDNLDIISADSLDLSIRVTLRVLGDLLPDEE